MSALWLMLKRIARAALIVPVALILAVMFGFLMALEAFKEVWRELTTTNFEQGAPS